VSTHEQSQVTGVGALNADAAGCISADAVFTLVMAACLIVDACLVRLLVEICDRFVLPLLPFVIAGLFAVIVVAFSIGPRLRAVAAQLRDYPGSIRKYDGVD
jgi:predicted RND superfamily exporter protein